MDLGVVIHQINGSFVGGFCLIKGTQAGGGQSELLQAFQLRGSSLVASLRVFTALGALPSTRWAVQTLHERRLGAESVRCSQPLSGELRFGEVEAYLGHQYVQDGLGAGVLRLTQYGVL